MIARHELRTIGQMVNKVQDGEHSGDEALARLVNAAERLDDVRQWLDVEIRQRRHQLATANQPDLFGPEVTR